MFYDGVRTVVAFVAASGLVSCGFPEAGRTPLQETGAMEANVPAPDRPAFHQATALAMETGHEQAWQNHLNGHHGIITPSRSYTPKDGRPCRIYSQLGYISGQSFSGTGTTCKDYDGEWRMASEQAL
jgi:surface antigen